MTEPEDGAEAHVASPDPTKQRWVLLEPPTAVARFWWRALAVALPVVSVVLLAWSPVGGGHRSGARWAVLGLALLITLVGCCWLWVAARLPRPISHEVDRVLAGRSWVERRRLEGTLRRAEPLADTDRPAAAGLAARARSALFHLGTTLSLLGPLAVLIVDSATGVASWGLLAYTGFVCLQALARADVAPLVADAPPPSPRVRGSSS